MILIFNSEDSHFWCLNFLGIFLCHLHLLTCLTQQQWAIRIWCLGLGICWHVGVQISETNTIQAWWVLIKLDGSWSNKHSGFFQLLLTIHPLPSIVMVYLPTFTAFTKKIFDLTKGKYTSSMVMVYLPRFTTKDQPFKYRYTYTSPMDCLKVKISPSFGLVSLRRGIIDPAKVRTAVRWIIEQLFWEILFCWILEFIFWGWFCFWTLCCFMIHISVLFVSVIFSHSWQCHMSIGQN